MAHGVGAVGGCFRPMTWISAGKSEFCRPVIQIYYQPTKSLGSGSNQIVYTLFKHLTGAGHDRSYS